MVQGTASVRQYPSSEVVRILERARRHRPTKTRSSVAIVRRAAGTCRTPPSDINASVLHQFFDDKIAAVRAATDDSIYCTFFWRKKGPISDYIFNSQIALCGHVTTFCALVCPTVPPLTVEDKT